MKLLAGRREQRHGHLVQRSTAGFASWMSSFLVDGLARLRAGKNDTTIGFHGQLDGLHVGSPPDQPGIAAKHDTQWSAWLAKPGPHRTTRFGRIARGGLEQRMGYDVARSATSWRHRGGGSNARQSKKRRSRNRWRRQYIP